MAGTYGWNINTEAAQQYRNSSSSSDDENDENLKMPMPYGHSADVANENVGSSDPFIKGYYWCDASQGIPPQAIKAGVDKDGGDIYVGRATHNGEIQPAKVVPNHGCAYVAWGGEEHTKNEYEILCKGQCAVIWQEAQGGAVPPGAVPVGITSENERLYIGRVFHDGTHTPGKVHPSHGVLYIPYDGTELSFPSYEVLILQ